MIGNPYGCIPHPPSAVGGKCVDAEPVKATEIALAMDAGFAGTGVQRAASPLRRDAGAAAHCWGQGSTPLGRVQGGSACRESKGQRPWPSEVLKAKRPEGFDTLYWVLPVETGALRGNESNSAKEISNPTNEKEVTAHRQSKAAGIPSQWPRGKTRRL